VLICVSYVLLTKILHLAFSAEIPGLAWTYDMRRMCVLVGQAWKFQEPVLLVGETGCGKTTAVQVVKYGHFFSRFVAKNSVTTSHSIHFNFNICLVEF
jgi:midasin (ATPase involved in ribosome maturation)